jgi:hypothetical protein
VCIGGFSATGKSSGSRGLALSFLSEDSISRGYNRHHGVTCIAITEVQDDGQLNVLTPFETASGSVPVEIITEQGTVMTTAMMAQVAPALFGYTHPPTGSTRWRRSRTRAPS